MPKQPSSQTKVVIGAYILGILVGTICFFFSNMAWLVTLPIARAYINEIFGIISVGLTMFLMLVTGLKHPPAAALALGLELDEWSLNTIFVTLLTIVLMLIVRDFSGSTISDSLVEASW